MHERNYDSVGECEWVQKRSVMLRVQREGSMEVAVQRIDTETMKRYPVFLYFSCHAFSLPTFHLPSHPNANFLHSVLQCDFHHHPMSPLHSSRCRTLLRFHHNCSRPTVIGLVKVYCSPLSKGLFLILPTPRHGWLPLWVVPLHQHPHTLKAWHLVHQTVYDRKGHKMRMHLISESVGPSPAMVLFSQLTSHLYHVPNSSLPASLSGVIRNFTSGSRKWFPGKSAPQHYFLGNSVCLMHLQ